MRRRHADTEARGRSSRVSTIQAPNGGKRHGNGPAEGSLFYDYRTAIRAVLFFQRPDTELGNTLDSHGPPWECRPDAPSRPAAASRGRRASQRIPGDRGNESWGDTAVRRVRAVF